MFSPPPPVLRETIIEPMEKLFALLVLVAIVMAMGWVAATARRPHQRERERREAAFGGSKQHHRQEA